MWATVILCIIQISLGAAFYLLTSNWLLGQLDRTLATTATQVAETLQGADFIDDGRLNFQFRDVDDPVNAFLEERLFFIRVIDQLQGEILVSSAGYDVDISPNARAVRTSYETLLLRDTTTTMRVYTLPLEEKALALQVGGSMIEVSATQAQIRRMIAAALLLTVILGVGSGLFLANRALIPIKAITRTAQQISEHDLTQRITRTLSDDELGQLARTFNTMLDRIEQAFQHQQRFTADAAHELRTPLSIMQTGIDVVLSQDRSPTQYRAALESVHEEVQRLTSLTVGLLTLARADSHTLTLHHTAMDFSILANTVVDQVTAIAEHKNITLLREIAPYIWLQADEDRMIQLTLNLIENAVKYTPNGGCVTVTLAQTSSQVCFTVADTGSGIAPEHLPHIFDRFYRMDRSRSRDQGGFGLGLAIVQQIVHLHGGEITVASEVGVGTQFLVRLPTS